ncbi:MAG: beta-ketoacyl-[acyl-carrier-protein] synthase family protein [Candidatus Brocadiia bacterium]
MSDRDIVISGVGCISPLGVSLEEFGASLRAGRSGVGEIASFDASAYPCRHGAEVLELELSEFIESSKTYIDRTSAYVLAACSAALEEAHWRGDESVGLVLGTAWGCMDSLELFAQKLIEGKPKFVPPLPFTHSYANAPNSLASIEFKLRGFNACVTCGHVSAAEAVAYACRRIALGKDRRLLAGGGEALSESVFHAACLGGGLLREGGPRPYHPRSSGMVLGEGAAVFALEEADVAREWRDPVLARICGYASCRGESVTDGLARSMRAALDHAKITPGEVGAVFGAANGRPDFDAAELEAIRAVFGGDGPVVTSVKALVGEGMGLGGATSLAAALCSLHDRFVPPAYGEEPPRLEGVRVVAREPLELRVRTALVNAADSSGACVSLVVASV